MARFVLVALLLVATSLVSAVPASAARPSPLPRPSVGGIRQLYCPENGYLSVSVSAAGGRTSFKVGDNVGLSVTVSAVNCDALDVTVKMPLGGGLQGSGLDLAGYSYRAGTPVSISAGGQAVRPGTWTYTAAVAGYSYGSTATTAAGCSGGVRTIGYSCGRSASATLTLTVAGAGTTGTGSSGGAQGQAGGAQGTAGGSGQGTISVGPVQLPSLGSTGVGGAVAGSSAAALPVRIGLALLVGLAVGLATLLIGRWVARRRDAGRDAAAGRVR